MEQTAPWLQRLIEKLTGRPLAGPDDARTWHCRPLVVTNQARDIVFAGNAMAEFTPTVDGQGVARVEGKEHIIAPLAVEKVSVTHSGDRGRTPNGLMLRGTAPDGSTFTWRINGAAVAFLKKQVHERWLGMEGEYSLQVEPRNGSLGTLE